MNFQQLRIIRESARCQFNLTDVASMLSMSQSGVSRHIRDFEDELGLIIFIRRGKRLIGMTEPGKALLTVVEQILTDERTIRRIGDVFSNKLSGELSLVTTHTQARYSLPPVIRAFRERFPQVRFVMHQGSAEEVSSMLHAGDADIGIVSEHMLNESQFSTFPFYFWHHTVLVPEGHPLLLEGPVTLEALCRYPLVTYRNGSSERRQLDTAFQAAGLTPDIVLSAQDSDVIKTYVKSDLGIGLVADIAYDAQRDSGLVSLSAKHLFAPNVVWLGVKRGQLQHKYAWHFIQLCNQQLSITEIEEKVMAPIDDDYQPDYQI